MRAHGVVLRDTAYPNAARSGRALNAYGVGIGYGVIPICQLGALPDIPSGRPLRRACALSGRRRRIVVVTERILHVHALDSIALWGVSRQDEVPVSVDAEQARKCTARAPAQDLEYRVVVG